jgi:hypothetical protein
MNPFGNTHRSALLSDSSGKKKGIEGADRRSGRGQQTYASLFHSLEMKEYDLEMRLEAGVFYLALDFKWNSALHCR